MDLFIASRALIIHGGKDDTSTLNGQSQYYSDIIAFDLSSREWINVVSYTSNEVPRCGHASAIIGSKLLVFGGMNPKGLVTGKVEFVELSQRKIVKNYTLKIMQLK